MALPQGIAFRATSGYVTDGATTYGDTSATGSNYPTTSTQGNTVGWESVITGVRDRNSALDPRLAGIAFISGAVTANYRIDLPTAGSYNVRVGAGDAGSSTNSVEVNLYDNSTLLANLVSSKSAALGTFYDATNTGYSSSAWPGSNTKSAQTFASTICRFRLGDSVLTNTYVLAFVYVEAAVGGGTSATATPAGVQATSAIGTPTAIGAAVANPAGVSATSAIGTPTATVSATALPAGVQATSAVGTPVAVGGANAYPAGVQVVSAIGVPTATGAAVALPAGVQAVSAVGTPIATGGATVPATAYPTGVQATSAVGTPVATGAAFAYPLGVQAISYIGVPIARSGAIEFGAPLISTPTPRNWISSSEPRNWIARNPPRNWIASKD